MRASCRAGGSRQLGSVAAFTAVNEIPALAFLALVSGLLLLRYPRQTLLCLVPAALVPIAASVAAQYAALGELKLVYTEFGTESYLWEGSLWKTPLELDALNLPWFDPQEAARTGNRRRVAWPLSLPHDAGPPRILVAHADLLLLAWWDWDGCLRRVGKPMAAVGLDDGGPDRRPAGLLHLEPQGPELRRLDPGPALALLADPVLAAAAARGSRGGPEPAAGSAGCLLALSVSVISVGYAMRNPWSHPWILDALEHLGIYSLPR